MIMGTWNDSRPAMTGLLFWAISAWIAPVYGQFDVENELLVEDLVQAVVQQNTGLTVQELRIRASRALAENAGALDDPRVSYSLAPSSIGTDIPSDFGNALRVRQTFQVSQLVPWPGKRPLRTELAEARIEVAEASYDELLTSVVQQARSLWLQLWFANQALSTNENHRALLTDLETVASTQYANGLGLQQDVLQIQTNLVELDHREFVLNQQIRRLQSRINELLNRSADFPVGSPRGQLPDLVLPDRSNLMQWILESEPELNVLEARSRVAQKQKRLVDLDDFPDIQISAGYNELWNNIELRTQVGISLNIPLDFGKRSSRKAAADFTYASSRADVVRYRSKLSADLEELLSTVDELVHSIVLFETELIPKAEQTFAAASANYQGGGGNFEALTQAQEQLLDMRLRISEMQADQLIAISEIDKLSGGRLWPLEIGQ